METCHRDCKLFANNLGCTLGQTCESLGDSNDPKHGICTSEQSAPVDPEPSDPDPVEEPTEDVSTSSPPDAATPSEPDSSGPEVDPEPETDPTTPEGTRDPAGEEERPEVDPNVGTGTGDLSGSRATPSGTTTGLDEDGSGEGVSDAGGCQSSDKSMLWWLALFPLAWLTQRRRSLERS